MKFRIQVEEELYYPSSENKGADQLRSYCEADLRLCFRLGRLLVFPWGSSLDGSNMAMCIKFCNTRSEWCIFILFFEFVLFLENNELNVHAKCLLFIFELLARENFSSSKCCTVKDG